MIVVRNVSKVYIYIYIYIYMYIVMEDFINSLSIKWLIIEILTKL